VADKRN